MQIICGKVFDIVHSQKGKFSIIVTEINGSLITGRITKGVAYYLTEEDRVPDDTITIDIDGPFVKISNS